MKFGIDLGTTRTLVAACDRGNYPVLSFTGPSGDAFDHVPTITAERDGVLVHGLEAEDAVAHGAPHLRSWKRLLGRCGADHRVRIGTVEVTLLDLATGFLVALRESILERSNVPKRARSQALEAVVSVPANAHSTQRWATLEAFRRAGFDVLRLVNEPSAAGIEFAHHHAGALTGKREHVAVYDLGGGTFDAALVCMANDGHDVVATSGVQELGGDDFDRVLAEMALERVGLRVSDIGDAMNGLLAECRAAKEGIGPSTRRVSIDLTVLGPRGSEEPVAIAVADFYERIRPMVDRSLDALGHVLGAEPEASSDWEATATDAGVAGLYVVGGASALPLVARHLRERFGRRVHRSAHPAGAIAIGLAVVADDAKRSKLRERFTRHFGVFREASAGERKVFDSIFASGTPMPSKGEAPLVATRTYRAAHDVGQLRFLECAGVSDELQPIGDITPHATILVPYERELRGRDLSRHAVSRLEEPGPLVEERFTVNASGAIAVTVRDLDDGHEQSFKL